MSGGKVVGILRKDGWTQLTVSPSTDPDSCIGYFQTLAVRCQGEPVVKCGDNVEWSAKGKKLIRIPAYGDRKSVV